MFRLCAAILPCCLARATHTPALHSPPSHPPPPHCSPLLRLSFLPVAMTPCYFSQLPLTLSPLRVIAISTFRGRGGGCASAGAGTGGAGGGTGHGAVPRAAWGDGGKQGELKKGRGTDIVQQGLEGKHCTPRGLLSSKQSVYLMTRPRSRGAGAGVEHAGRRRAHRPAAVRGSRHSHVSFRARAVGCCDMPGAGLSCARWARDAAAAARSSAAAACAARAARR